MHRHHAVFTEPGIFFAVQSWADCITNMFGFDLRQAQVVIDDVGLVKSLTVTSELETDYGAIATAGNFTNNLDAFIDIGSFDGGQGGSQISSAAR